MAENNTKSPGLLAEQQEACAIIIYGATGDLTARKLIPALFYLDRAGCLHSETTIIGIGRRELKLSEFIEDLVKVAKTSAEAQPFDELAWEKFCRRIDYLSGDYSQDDTQKQLTEKLEQLKCGNNRIFYLATPPTSAPQIIKSLANCQLNQQNSGYSRLIIEKPFGRDLESALQLNLLVGEYFQENQIYRIDHYLGKETVQNILYFRFGNEMFEPIWNRNHISHIEITAAEPLGVGHRAGYYNESGAVRDMVANHVLQLLSLVAMEAPTGFSADAVRDRKNDVWRAVRLYNPEDIAKCCVRGQYLAGQVDGEKVVGWLEETNVPKNSKTETYVALELRIDNWRWAGVPFYLRSGKRLAQHVTEIAIHFKEPPLALFNRHDELSSNTIVLRIQPDEGISLGFGAKSPGARQMTAVSMDFCYHHSFAHPPSAYAVLLLDTLLGDATLFTRRDGVEAQWRIIDPILKTWEKDNSRLATYPSGSDGPQQANLMLAKNGHAWRAIAGNYGSCNLP